jgi:ubiquinone/menaquinone biosynthesis C-methylase UbiE
MKQTGQPSNPDYILGHGEDELDRLLDQAHFYGDLTEHLFHLAGIQRGMRVLDVGCGVGDVTFLAARLVGSDGYVMGVDKSPEAIRTAEQRAQAAQLTNVRFVVQDIAQFTPDEPVDAVVGRLILMYLADPVGVIRRLLGTLKPGAIVVFQEMDMAAAKSEPTCEVFETTANRIRQTFARAGINFQLGLRLGRIFEETGLAAPQMIQGARVESGPYSPVYATVEQITRTLLPLMEKMEVATADEVQVETLAARLREEAIAKNAVVIPPPLIGAWARFSD